MTRFVFAAVTLIFFASSVSAAGVTNLATDPGSPAVLDYGESVTISFDYDMMGETGRIFARPFSDGSLSPSYGASPSPLYTGVGSVTNAVFTIFDSGLAFVHVDQIRVQIVNSDQSILLSEQFFEADITFGTPPAVPLPASVLLLAGGLGLLGVVRRRKRT